MVAVMLCTDYCCCCAPIYCYWLAVYEPNIVVIVQRLIVIVVHRLGVVDNCYKYNMPRCPDGWGENKILEWVRFVSVVSEWRFWLVQEVLRVEGFH